MNNSLVTDWLDEPAQRNLLDAVTTVLEQAPLYTPHMPHSGRPLSVSMSNCGPLGWYSDQAEGYRYIAAHPGTGRPWPKIPASLLALWDRMTDYPAPPQACLINYYTGTARMGLHLDSDEAARSAPVLSVSLGDTAMFRLGGPRRTDPTRSFKLLSGTVLVLEGERRHWYHGVDRVLAGSSGLVAGGGRFNLTLRRVKPPDST
jgi:alkylated DNA repair protein (DNA oxidative demethylase)